MKILYGVQGTGNGHIARARAMVGALKQYGVTVDFLFTGRADNKYFSMQEFGDYQTRNGLTFNVSHGRVSNIKTLLQLNPCQLMKEVKQLDLSDYDLVINDFEPISAWAAKKQGVASISVSHQNAFRYAVPKKGDSWLDRNLIEHFAPADFYLALHWYHYQQPILPPIIHHIVSNQAVQDFVLVYLPFESLDSIRHLLSRFSCQRFICYHPAVNEEWQQEHLTFKPQSFIDFQYDLHACQGVIANGGFELPSEALSLGKKLLLKPLHKQFEQMSNVATLDSLGLAHTVYWLDPSAVSAWLDERQAEKVLYPDVASSISQWIMAGEWQSTSVLCQRLWEQVDFPDYASV